MLLYLKISLVIEQEGQDCQDNNQSETDKYLDRVVVNEAQHDFGIKVGKRTKKLEPLHSIEHISQHAQDESN